MRRRKNSVLVTLAGILLPSVLPVALVGWAMLAGPISVVENLIHRF
jgi:hypothetical protein